MAVGDAIADALRPSFAESASRMREILNSGAVGEVSVLGGHLPKAVVQVSERVNHDGGRHRTFNMCIPSVAGAPHDPDSVVSFISQSYTIGPAEQVLESILFFEKNGPEVLAKSIRSCLLGLLLSGISHEDLISEIMDSVATLVMKV